MATTMYTDAPMEGSTSSGKYLKVPCCHTYRPQPIEHVQKSCYGSHTVTLGQSIGPIRTGHNQHTHTGTLANPSHNSKFLVFIRYPESQLEGSHFGPQPIECHVLNPYPKPQLKDTFRVTTHGTPANPPRTPLKGFVSSYKQSSESDSPERELQVLTLFHAHTYCTSDPKHISTTPIL
ncbi:hypothetical protein DEO72_LG4g472 [Vigna unguiculata]|uniref:Uncharacterized protein n=1 Tax=Vigna unguiculata TaxID=3917 RepID=A0A4D6LMQ1_VIGUN|nr:hypothetical protein DEO72_LG4g472 [Vigna unguiculata]